MIEWRAVIGNETNYLVSNTGLVFSLRKQQYLKPNKNGSVSLNRKTVRVGCIVLEAFIGPCPKGMECCHQDDNPHNNTLPNLRWDTHAANVVDAWRNGGYKQRNHARLRGEANGHSKLTLDDLLEAKMLREREPGAWPYHKLAVRYGVCTAAIHHAMSGRNWAHLMEKNN
jgi:hypothetical protein